jgi:phospholipase C
MNPGVKGRIHLQFNLEEKKDFVIKKVVVLCMENRSFDHMLGYLDGVNGVKGREDEFEVQGVKPCDKAQHIQLIDLGHEVPHAQKQLKGEWISDAHSMAYTQLISSKWTVKNLYLPPEEYVKIESETCMHCFKPENIPIISTLAKEFCVFENWHASLAGPTQPNRWFLHCGTSDGILHNHEISQSPIIYDLFEEDEWKIFYHDVSSTTILNKNMIKKLKNKKQKNIEPFHEFYKSAKDGNLPKYTFLEPCYFTCGKDIAQDQHPPHDVRPGEQLILDIYTALLSNEKQFEETLFLIVYDEHGGFWDHVDPPVVPKMKEKVKNLNDGVFSTLGFRVPAIAINPHIKKGTIEKRLFDHCSVPATLTKLFNLSECLTERVFHANTFDDVLNLSTPRKTKEMPDPFKLQEALNEVYKMEYKNDNIPKETIKKLLENPRGFMIAQKSFACLKWVYEKKIGKKNQQNSLLKEFENDFENATEDEQAKMLMELQQKFMDHTDDEILENSTTPIPWQEEEIKFE